MKRLILAATTSIFVVGSVTAHAETLRPSYNVAANSAQVRVSQSPQSSPQSSSEPGRIAKVKAWLSDEWYLKNEGLLFGRDLKARVQTHIEVLEHNARLSAVSGNAKQNMLSQAARLKAIQVSRGWVPKRTVNVFEGFRANMLFESVRRMEQSKDAHPLAALKYLGIMSDGKAKRELKALGLPTDESVQLAAEMKKSCANTPASQAMVFGDIDGAALDARRSFIARHGDTRSLALEKRPLAERRVACEAYAQLFVSSLDKDVHEKNFLVQTKASVNGGKGHALN